MHFQHYHRFLNPSSGSSGFWALFLGAFFAFVFGLVTYIITKRRERFVQHKNTLVKLDRALNKHLNDLGVLETLILDTNRLLGEGKASTNRLFHLKMPDGVDLDLGSIELINKVFTYNLSIDRLNFNFDSVNHALTLIEDLFINGQFPQPENFNFIRRLLDSLTEDLPRMNERTMTLLVLTRLHQKRLQSRSTFIYGVFNSSWEPKISKDDIDTERKVLTDEIKDTIARGDAF